MDAFAVQVATAVHENTDWLIFVEGTSTSPTCDDIIDGDEVVCGYGDNLKGSAAGFHQKAKPGWEFHFERVTRCPENGWELPIPTKPNLISTPLNH